MLLQAKKQLVELADSLDQKGLTKEADQIDKILTAWFWDQRGKFYANFTPQANFIVGPFELENEARDYGKAVREEGEGFSWNVVPEADLAEFGPVEVRSPDVERDQSELSIQKSLEGDSKGLTKEAFSREEIKKRLVEKLAGIKDLRWLWAVRIAQSVLDSYTTRELAEAILAGDELVVPKSNEEVIEKMIDNELADATSIEDLDVRINFIAETLNK